jgi:hypothetical protein
MHELSIACDQLKPDKKDSDLLLNSNVIKNVPNNFMCLSCVCHQCMHCTWFCSVFLTVWYYYSSS